MRSPFAARPFALIDLFFLLIDIPQRIKRFVRNAVVKLKIPRF